tara:strand:- start:158 stop:400 length:243 start_codon:yes stop_codon:yes gene_type:complete
MNRFLLSFEDYTIILNALHYYKKVEKRGAFKQYDDDRVNAVRDKMALQITGEETDEGKLKLKVFVVLSLLINVGLIWYCL